MPFSASFLIRLSASITKRWCDDAFYFLVDGDTAPRQPAAASASARHTPSAQCLVRYILAYEAVRQTIAGVYAPDACYPVSSTPVVLAGLAAWVLLK